MVGEEAQALAALNHPHIVSVFDFGIVVQSSGLPSGESRGLNHIYYLFMQFVDGVNLRQLLQTKCLTPKEALSIVPPVCDALQCAHDHDLVFTGNTFSNKPATIVVDPTCTRSTIEGNLGAKTVKKPVDFNHGRR
ncbi:MAG: hypothetical protein HS117_06870 [Verrucomicrobiaceae bacterium]|jgi:serine/threonine protein kinase|nr:hypothetical protein [Verrucomicrobiaceae bacterium]